MGRSGQRAAIGQLARLLDRGAGAASASAAWLASVFTVVIMVSVAADVARRAVENRSIPGVVEYTELLMVALVYLGLGYAQRTGRHIDVDVVMRWTPPRVAAAMRVVGMLVLIAISALLVYATSVRAWESFDSSEIRMGLLRVTIWPSRVLVAAGLALFLVEVARSLILLLQEIRQSAATINESARTTQQI